MTRGSGRLQFIPEVIPSVGSAFNVLGEAMTLQARSVDGSWSLFHVTTPAAAGPPPHHHPWEETHYVLDGELEFRLGERVTRVTSGMSVQVPPDTLHSYVAQSPCGARFLTLVSPAGVERMFEALQQASSSGDMGRVVQIAREHGVRAVVPSAAE